MKKIFHITPKRDWDPEEKEYRADTLSSQGFIHCSTGDQVVGVADHIFKGRKDLRLLIIDEEKVKPPIRYEDAGDGNLYPHIYGPLNSDAVVAVLEFQPKADGSFGMPLSLEIRRVQRDAAPEVLEICTDAALWLKGKEIVQWDDFLDPEKAKAIVDKRFDEGEVFIGYLNSRPVATITVQWEDAFWGELGADPDSGYIHTMAVRRDHAGLGLGRELLDWAGNYFAAAKKTKMRLDVVGDNSRLCCFYDDLGFKTIGRKDWKGWHLLMKERNLRDLSGDSDES